MPGRVTKTRTETASPALKQARKQQPAKPSAIDLTEEAQSADFSVMEFRTRLNAWYRTQARDLPWRGVDDPYATWLSETMLQQTRVVTVIDRYHEFLQRFPTVSALAEADEADVLAKWSGLGYYNRARLLHRAAQFVVRELQGKLPTTIAQLRTLPGVGEYTSAAIASIAFGESVAAIDGNVERVLLRVLGLPESRSAPARAALAEVAQQLVPPAAIRSRAAHSNPPGDHNQAMMELGATVCLPRSPLCLHCPVVKFCKTRGEHATGTRPKQQCRTVAHLLAVRKRGVITEVLLERRAKDAAVMPNMLELPPLPLEAGDGREPALRLRHAITTTNFYVHIFTQSSMDTSLQKLLPASAASLRWTPVTKLSQLPLTGLARKVLHRLQLMEFPPVRVLKRKTK